MGVFDIFEDHDDKRRHEKAYSEGVKDAQNAGCGEKAEHGLNDLFGDLFGKGSTENRSYDAGYHSGKKWSEPQEYPSAYTGSTSSASDPKDIALKFAAILIIIGGLALIWNKTLFYVPNNASAPQSTRRINANELNLRSGPGKQYSIVRIFTRKEEIVSYDSEQQTADGFVWVRAKTTDGQTEGWIVAKYLTK